MTPELQARIEPEPNTGCWLRTGSLNHCGYGRFKVDRVEHIAHRLVYEQIKGPIPAGLVLDHRCLVRTCVNPGHLEPVTPSENSIRAKAAHRKEQCPRGHEYSASKDPKRKRECRTCQREKGRRNDRRRWPTRRIVRGQATLAARSERFATRAHRIAEADAEAPTETPRCKRGHAMYGRNLLPRYGDRAGTFHCRICYRARARRHYQWNAPAKRVRLSPDFHA
jgi:hypothetical protein